ncbi:MAG: hypothetical protein JWO38_595 [Gemmataceae bacterium]|nr:hypothetical protein [Gemmataceae bacterium]
MAKKAAAAGEKAKRPAKAATKTPAAAKKPATKDPVPTTDFAAVFDRLKAILTPYAPGMIVVKDDPGWYYLDTKTIGANKKPVMFAAVRLGKNYVSFHLMPLYMNPVLQGQVSPALKRRQQGKACFNFAAVDEGLFAELADHTRAGRECFKKIGIE